MVFLNADDHPFLPNEEASKEGANEIDSEPQAYGCCQHQAYRRHGELESFRWVFQIVGDASGQQHPACQSSNHKEANEEQFQHNFCSAGVHMSVLGAAEAFFGSGVKTELVLTHFAVYPLKVSDYAVFVLRAFLYPHF